MTSSNLVDCTTGRSAGFLAVENPPATFRGSPGALRSRRQTLMPCEDAAAECRHRRNLPPGKIRISVLVPGIGDLDPNRARVEINISRPGRHSSMPSAPRLRPPPHLSTSIAARPVLVMRSAIGPISSSRRQTGSEPPPRTSSNRPARMSL
jgi:hypothetical protein